MSPDNAIDARRRTLLLWLTSLTAGCVTSLPDPPTRPLATPGLPPPVRPPSRGQEWVYAVRNIFNRQEVDTLTETVLSVGNPVRIGRVGMRGGVLDEELQDPWGMILQDPHWSPTVSFSEALPLWPRQLTPGWSGDFSSRYQVPIVRGALFDWQLSMKALDWEEITVPAGTFRAFRFFNYIRFQSYEFYYRLSSERRETLWLVPEIGRWALRRSSGIYYIEGHGSIMREDNLEWELLSWKAS